VILRGLVERVNKGNKYKTTKRKKEKENE